MTTPFPPEIVSVAFGLVGPTLDPDIMVLNDPVRGLLDTGTLGEADAYVSATEFARRITINRPCDNVTSPVIRYGPGTAEVTLDNAGREWDPENLDGPFVVDGESLLQPSVPVIISARWSGVDYRLYTGFADSWNLTWNGDNWAETTVPAMDGLDILQNTSSAGGLIVGGGETTGARVNRLLDTALWPDEDRLISTGDSTVMSSNLAGGALEQLQLVADSEVGEMYVNGAGQFVFRNRNAIFLDARSNTSQATFGDDEDGGELGYVYNGATFVTDRETLYNRVIAQRTGGVAQQADDTASRAKHRIRTWEKTDLVLFDDDQVADYAGFLLHLSRTPENRFTSVTIDPYADPDNLFPQVLGREIGDRITLFRRPAGGGDPIAKDVFIRGISHEITMTTWRTTWTLQSATRYSFMELDDPLLGQLDQNALGF